MTADQFEKAYAARTKISVRELRSYGRVVRPCTCDEDGCEGWQSVNSESWEEDQRLRGEQLQEAADAQREELEDR